MTCDFPYDIVWEVFCYLKIKQPIERGVIMIHDVKGFRDLVVIVKNILENSESGFPVKIWDGRILLLDMVPLNVKDTEDVSKTICEKRLAFCLAKLLADEKPFEITVKFIRHLFTKKVSLELTFGEIRNFIENIIRPSVYDVHHISDNEFRILVEETFPEKFESTDIVSPIISCIVENLDDEGTNDKLFRYKIKELCS